MHGKLRKSRKCLPNRRRGEITSLFANSRVVFSSIEFIVLKSLFPTTQTDQ